MNNMDTEASAAFSNGMRLQHKACAKGDEKLALRKHVASKHEGTCFSKATVTRADNRERGSRTGRATACTGPHNLRSSLLNSQM